jgi:hypothetical protein
VSNGDAMGVAVFFDGGPSYPAARTGDSAGTQRVSIYTDAECNGFTSLTAGAPRYLKETTTAGSTDTATEPSTAASYIQVVGKAVSATEVLYRILPALAKVQAAGNSTVAFR